MVVSSHTIHTHTLNLLLDTLLENQVFWVVECIFCGIERIKSFGHQPQSSSLLFSLQIIFFCLLLSLEILHTPHDVFYSIWIVAFLRPTEVLVSTSFSFSFPKDDSFPKYYLFNMVFFSKLVWLSALKIGWFFI